MKIPEHLLYGDLKLFQQVTGVSPDALIEVEQANLKMLDYMYEQLRKKWRDEEIENDMIDGYPVSTVLYEIDKKRKKKKAKLQRYKVELLKDGR